MSNIMQHALLMVDQSTLLRYVFFCMTVFISMRFAVQSPNVKVLWTEVFTMMHRVVILLFSKLLMSNITAK
jgi:hypothetical protein